MLILKLFGIDPKSVRQLLITNVKEISKISIRYYEGFMETKLEVDEEDNFEFRHIFSDLMLVLSKYIYATEDITIYERLAQFIIQRKKTFTMFEQGSVGRIVNSILSFENTEKYIDESSVFFSNEKFIKHFDMESQQLIETAKISSKNIYDIATNLLSKSFSDIIVVTLGVHIESDEMLAKTMQPKGLCFVAIGDRNGIDVNKYMFSGTKNEIIESISKTACWNIIKKLK